MTSDNGKLQLCYAKLKNTRLLDILNHVAFFNLVNFFDKIDCAPKIFNYFNNPIKLPTTHIILYTLRTKHTIFIVSSCLFSCSNSLFIFIFSSNFLSILS